MAVSTHHQIVCRTEGPFLRVDVNDVPIARWEGSRGGQTVEHLNPWLIPGENVIRVVMAWPAGGGVAPGEGRVDVAVHELSGDAPVVDRVVARYVWPPEGDGGAAARERRVAVRRGRHEALVKVTPVGAPATALWAVAERLVGEEESLSGVGAAKRAELLGREVRGEITSLVVRLQRAVNRLDLETVVELLAYRTSELARAFHVPEDRVLGELVGLIVASLPEEVLDGARALAPEDVEAREEDLEALESELQVHLVAHGRLAWVTRPGFGPAVRTPGPPPRFETGVFVGRVAGRLLIVR